MNYLQKKIVKMMTENTGRHILDSGGAYGRHWERNQGVKFDFNNDVKLDEYGATIPIHVYMNTMFDLDDNTAHWNRLLGKNYYWVQEAVDELLDRGFDLEFGGYLGMTDADNTYNSDNDLSQNFQYQLFEYDGECYCAFQLHNGCDVRGGYTNTQIFKVNDPDYFYIGWRVDFYDNSNDEQFESFYQIEENDNYQLSIERQCFINKETNEEVYPYSAAIGF